MTDSEESSSGSAGWAKGVGLALPIVFGYLPVGFAYGVLAQKAGLSMLNTMLMSFMVYAGSSQLIAVGLMQAVAAPINIILVTFVVNLRLLIMASALAPFLKRWTPLELSSFAFQLTDETFALHSTRFQTVSPSKPSVFATNVTAHMAWLGGSWVGASAGQWVSDVRPYALDYALPALFIALLCLLTKDRIMVFTAIFSGVLAVALMLAGLDQWYVITATVIGASFGTGVERWTRKKSS